MIRYSSITDDKALDRVRGAIQDLTLRFPLAGLSILGEAVEVVEDRSVQTMSTDGRKIYYSPKWIYTLAERDSIYTTFDVLHEWLHIFMNHVARRGDKDGETWNIACDIFVVTECCTILSQAGRTIEPPEDGVQPQTWANGLTVEEIYEKLVQDPKLKPPPAGGLSGDFLYGAAGDYGVSFEDNFKQKFIEELHTASAIMTQIRQGDPSQFGHAVHSRLQELTKGTVPWGKLLKGDLLSAMGDEFATYARPKRRYYPFILLPTYHSYKERILLIAVDISASVGNTLLKEFISNITPAAMRAEKCVVLTFDAIVREEVHTRRPQDVLKHLEFLQGAHSGTSVLEVFEVADRINPSGIAVLTDGWITIPDKPYKNTHWVIPENGREQPWGRNYKMAVSW